MLLINIFVDNKNYNLQINLSDRLNQQYFHQ